MIIRRSSFEGRLSGVGLLVLTLAGLMLMSCGQDRRELHAIKVFYDANDAGRYDASLAMTTQDVRLDSWALAINGNHLGTRHLAGQAALRQVLGGRGLCRDFYGTDGPLYVLRNMRVSGSDVAFELLPDRRTPDGRPYNIYRGNFSFVGDKIRSITMVEVIGWL